MELFPVTLTLTTPNNHIFDIFDRLSYLHTRWS